MIGVKDRGGERTTLGRERLRQKKVISAGNHTSNTAIHGEHINYRKISYCIHLYI